MSECKWRELRVVFWACEVLDVPNTVAAAAMLLLHRATSPVDDPRTAVELDPGVLKYTVIFLAAKIEEAHRSIRDVINAVDSYYDNFTFATVEEYFILKEDIVRQEQLVLRAVGFAVSYSFPFTHTLHYAKLLRLDRECVQYAWSLLNDCYSSHRILRMDARVMAGSCLLIAVSLFLEDDALERVKDEVWEAFVGEEAAVEECCEWMLDTVVAEKNRRSNSTSDSVLEDDAAS